MRYYKHYLGIFLYATLLSPTAYGQEATLEDFLEGKIYSVSRREERAFDAPAAIYVVTAEDIKRMGVTTVPEALRMVPGLQVARQGSHTWAISARGFNFQFANKLLVMIDGRTIYTPLFSGVFWDAEPMLMDNIEKIEVVLGPGGTLWGANAVNGVINIITKHSGTTEGQYIGTYLGTQGQRIVEARHGQKLAEDQFFRVYAKQFHNEESETTAQDIEQDAWEGNTSGFRFDMSQENGDLLSVDGHFHSTRATNFLTVLPSQTPPFSYTGSRDKTSQGGHISAKWDHWTDSGSHMTLKSYVNYSYFDMTLLERAEYTADLDFQHTFNTSKNNSITWGAGYRHIKDSLDDSIFIDYSDERMIDNVLSAFLQNRYAIIPDSLYVTLGSKIEHNDYTAFEVQPNIRLAYYPSQDQTLWAALSRAVRTPNRGEHTISTLAVNPFSPGTFIAQRGNEQFESESLTAFELGYRIRPKDSWLFSTSFFYNIYDDLRAFDIGPGDGDGSVVSASLNINNKGKGFSYGTEAVLEWKVVPTVKVQASYSVLEMSLKRDDGVLDPTLEAIEKQFPNQQTSIRTNVDLPYDMEWNTMLAYIDKLPIANTPEIENYLKLDTRVSWEPYKGKSISLIGKNLTDDRHPEFQAGLFNVTKEVGRSVLVQLRVDL